MPLDQLRQSRSSESFNAMLNTLSRQVTKVVAAASGLWGGVTMAATLAVVIWLDLLWELSPEARAICVRLAPWMLLAGGIAILLFARRWSRGANLAKHLDQVGATGGKILTGYDLANCQSTGSPVTDGLAQMAVADAVQLAHQINPRQIIPAGTLKRPLATAGGLFLLLVVLAFTMPGLLQTQWLRLWDPFGDHPPYTGVTFNVQPRHASVLYGQPIDIYAEVDGAYDDRMELVLLPETHAVAVEPQVVPMFLEPDQRWRAAVANLSEPCRYFVRAGRARSHRYQLEVVTIPQIEEVTFRITPPEYTRLPAHEGPLPRGGLTGLVGSRVAVTAVSNRALLDGELKLKLGNQLKNVLLLSTQSDDNRTVTGEFMLTQSGSFELRVIDVEGQLSSEPFRGALVETEDHSPIVRLVQPRKQSFATPSVNLPVVVAAEDDYGVANVRFYRSLNGARPLPVDAKMDQVSRSAQHTFTLPLSRYGLEPGDEIRLFARATDTDPNGPNSAESGVATIQIISEQEFRRAVQQREGAKHLVNKYRQARRRLANLKETARQLQEEIKKAAAEKDGDTGDFDNETPLSIELQERLAALKKQLAEQQQEIRKLAEYKLPYDVDEGLNKELSELAKRLKEYSEQMQEKTSQDGTPKQGKTEGALESLISQLEQELGQFDQKAIQPLEYLEQVLPLLQDMMRFVALAQQQQFLAERLATYKSQAMIEDDDERRRMRDLEDEQHALQAALGQLLDQIADHAKQLPEAEELEELRATAQTFVDDVRASGAQQAMQSAELALGGFEGAECHRTAQKAADILASFIKQCNGMGQKCQGACKLRFQPSMGAACKLGNTLPQLLAKMGMGQGSGSGMGMGGVGGMSASPGGPQQMGLYGELPTYDMMKSASGAGGGNDAAAGKGRAHGAAFSRTTNWTESSGSVDVSGGAAAQAPLEYRRRVSAYLRKLAEELEQQ